VPIADVQCYDRLKWFVCIQQMWTGDSDVETVISQSHWRRSTGCVEVLFFL